MTQDEIIELAKEAGIAIYGGMIWINDDDATQELEAFAKLIAAKELENNVKLLIRLADSYEHADKQGSADDIYKIVDYIRKKGKA